MGVYWNLSFMDRGYYNFCVESTHKPVISSNKCLNLLDEIPYGPHYKMLSEILDICRKYQFFDVPAVCSRLLFGCEKFIIY